LLLLASAAHAEARRSGGHASSNAEYGIVMREETPGRCRVEVTRDTDPLWTLPRCLGSVDDLYFVSDSGQRFWVLSAVPKKIPPSSKAAKAARTRSVHDKPPAHDAYAEVVVAVLYDRLGNVLSERRLGEFLSPASYHKLRDLDRRFVWLEGVAGVPGHEPHVTDKNQVEFDTVERRTHRLGFQE
jgi:hypothetical protein